MDNSFLNILDSSRKDEPSETYLLREFEGLLNKEGALRHLPLPRTTRMRFHIRGSCLSNPPRVTVHPGHRVVADAVWIAGPQSGILWYLTMAFQPIIV